MSVELETIFHRDLEQFFRRLDPLLSRLEAGSAERDAVEESFRIMHSIKSEAAHLGFEEVAGYAHRAETILQELGEEPANRGYLNQLFTAIDSLRGALPEAGPVDQAGSSEPAALSVASISTPAFTAFEDILLRESRDRGESFYRMVCDFDPETEMKYAKAVLILNNLEQMVNVIRTLPDLRHTGLDEPSSVAYFFTTAIPETDLFNAVRIDQVRRVFLSRLAWEQHLPEGKGMPSADAFPGEVRVSVPREQLARLWYDLLKARLAWYSLPAAENAGEELREALSALNTTLQTTSTLPLGQLFGDLQAVVEQTATEQEKEARLEIVDRDMPLERWLAQQLHDAVLQLVRNAVSHGIEERTVRLREGKSPRGEVFLRCEEDDRTVRIIVGDDGRGIDEEAVRGKAAELGLDRNASLISILSSHGFSTSDNPSMHSGRGVGLDIVADGIRRLPGAELGVEQGAGGGARFILSVPRRLTGRRLQFARHKQRFIGIDSEEIEDRERPKGVFFSRDAEGRINYRGLPVYTCDGYLFWIDGFPEEEQLLKIGASDRPFYLLVQELLFEEQFPPDLIGSRENSTQPLSTMMIADWETRVELLRSDALLQLYTP